MAIKTVSDLDEMMDRHAAAEREAKCRVFREQLSGGEQELTDLFRKHCQEEMRLAEAIYGNS